jgi:hypothetical protein
MTLCALTRPDLEPRPFTLIVVLVSPHPANELFPEAA